ncbi:unannotated protein [freshwater metagenome]|uniref:DNA 3'-5' helicase n=1 Tax=freshwater metagenome TaxID=449393 RepID=A0A6J7GGA2_9ZZZZ|nr:AAA family ATPase [Actinomycetota bacterium]
MKHNYASQEFAASLGIQIPSDEQALVIEAPLSPGVVIAGAGSGKTETMSARVLWLVHTGQVLPAHILGLTFSKKAAAELGERIEKRLLTLSAKSPELDGLPFTGDPSEVTTSTYHSYAGRLVGEYGLRMGIDSSGDVVGDSRIWQLAHRLIMNYDGDMSALSLAPDTVIERVLDLGSEMLEHQSSADEVRALSENLATTLLSLPDGKFKYGTDTVNKIASAQQARLTLLPLVEALEQEKAQRHLYSFNDIMGLAAKLALAIPEIGVSERKKFKVVLLDEYQDTSPAQLTMLKALFAHDDHAVMAVGDPHQSIYAWRGAAAHTIEGFPHDFALANGAPAANYQMRTSWRSDRLIIDLANLVTEKHLKARDVAPLTARTESGLGEISARFFTDPESEAESIADELALQWSKSDRPTVAILVRQRSQIEFHEKALRRRGLPVLVSGIGGLLSEPEVADIRATLDVLVNIEAGDSLMRLLTSPRWNFVPRDLVTLGRYLSRKKRSQSEYDINLLDTLDELEDVVGLSDRSRERLTEFNQELRSLRRETHLALPEMILTIFQTLNLGIELSLYSPSSNRLRNVMRLIEEAMAFNSTAQGSSGPQNIRNFLAYLLVAERKERGLSLGGNEISTEAIQIMTVHGSKGLEWDVVAVPGLCTDVFPSKDRGGFNWQTTMDVIPFPLRGDLQALPLSPDYRNCVNRDETKAILGSFSDECKAHVESEEYRLGYVAFTRAKHVLLASGYSDPALQKGKEPSPLLHLAASFAESAHLDPEGPFISGDDAAAGWPREPRVLTPDVMEAFNLGKRRTLDEIGSALPEMLPSIKFALAAHRSAEEVFHLPQQYSVSALVAMATDPEKMARALRRPMPNAPTFESRRGTEFHLWVETHLKRPALLDLDDVEVDSEDELSEMPLDEMQIKWMASEWSDKEIYDVEVPFDLDIDGITISGRIDAIYREGNSWSVVDWKTGGVKSGEDLTAAAVQLAVYRLAFAKLEGIPVADVSGAFHYVPSNTTIRPADLLNESELAELITRFHNRVRAEDGR